MKTSHFIGRGLFASIFLAFTLGAAPSVDAASTVFTNAPGFVMESMDFDSSGNLYYVSTDYGAFTSATQIIKRTAASGYSDPVAVFTYSGVKFGTFVTVNGGRVYFGESSDGTIRSIDLGGGAPTLHATVPGIYDLAFSPSGEAFLSANAGGFGSQSNEVRQLNLATGVETVIINATNDFSGPVDFDVAGNLYYAGSGFGASPPTAIYRFSPTQLLGMMPLALSDGFLLADPGGSSHLEYVDGDGLYRHLFGGLSLVDIADGSMSPVAGEPAPSMGSIAFYGQDLYGISTDFTTSVSRFVLIPEPSSMGLLILPFLAFSLCRSRRRV